ncbi:MAG TPA: hypothetical protein PKN04_17020 [bacterium]|nr:hypothetical protein [bacterium]HNT67491.1 hypothetical protein [bacterium]HOX86275.1 hypothetical protein [bacterium]HPG45511.1 hypothetical protein [bacterium]HPM97710.1 hypothetical protein [bacterium]
MLRGGSWNNNPNNCRASNRNRNNPDNRNNNNGFRVARPAQLFPEPKCCFFTKIRLVLRIHRSVPWSAATAGRKR